MTRLSRLFATLGIMIGLPATAQWPQYLGPNGDATSPETGLLDAWPDGGPTQLWRVEMGPGFGGAAVHNGEVFVLDRVMGEADVLRVLDLNTGEEKWRHRYDAEGRVGYEGSRCTPAVTDTHVFTTGEFGHVHAFNRATREVAWSLNIMEKYPDTDDSEGQNWGYGVCPLVVDGKVVIVSPAQETPGLVAFDQHTGEVVWESEPFGDSNMYNSPVMRTIAGRTAIVVRDIDNLYFIDPETGGTLFEHKVYDRGKIPITPVTVMPDGEQVLITQGYDMGSVMLSITADANGGFTVREQYKMVEGSQIHPGVVVGQHIYINHTENSSSSGSRRRYAGLACINPADGKILWNTGENPFIGRGAVIHVDGKLILQDSEGGMLYLIEPSPEGFRPISSFQAVDADKKLAWAPLAIGDGRLLVRDQDEMRCFDLRAE